ncbi:MAG: type II toxin-antitoxin system Phd/YefM family antitoxin [Candidatus Binatia bacterium]
MRGGPPACIAIQSRREPDGRWGHHARPPADRAPRGSSRARRPGGASRTSRSGEFRSFWSTPCVGLSAGVAKPIRNGSLRLLLLLAGRAACGYISGHMESSGEVSVRELKNQTTAILRRVEAGERVTVTKRGRAIATIEPASRVRAATRESIYQNCNDRLRPVHRLCAAPRSQHAGASSRAFHGKSCARCHTRTGGKWTVR